MRPILNNKSCMVQNCEYLDFYMNSSIGDLDATPPFKREEHTQW